MSTLSIWNTGRHVLAASAMSVLAAACATAPAEEAPVETAEPNIEAIHERVLVLDAHADIVLPSTSALYLAADGESKVEPSKLEAGGVDAVVMAVAVGPGPRTAEGDAAARAETDEKLAAVQALVASSPETLALVTSADEIMATVESGQTALILGFQNARAFGGDVDAIDAFYEAGVRVFGFNHIGHNDFSDSSRPVFISELGAYEPAEEHNGLSELGVAAVARINALGGVIDVSQ
ncbi:MAG: membrane dipeptidase, partial [Pseudomonadota bacterium]